MNIGIVGHEAAKFTPNGEEQARQLIRTLLQNPKSILVSGHCHLGGIDIWAEEEARKLGRDMIIYPPAAYNWHDGYKPRNIKIAQTSDIVHCIVVDELPATFTGYRFLYCYHCKTSNHIKSGGCWTAKRAKEGRWHVINQEITDAAT